MSKPQRPKSGTSNKASRKWSRTAVPSERKSAAGPPVPPQAAGAAAAAEEAPRKRGRRLRTVAHVKVGLAHLIREMESGRMEDVKRGNAMTYAYSTLANVMSADVANDLADLREMLTKLGQEIAEQDRIRGGKPR